MLYTAEQTAPAALNTARQTVPETFYTAGQTGPVPFNAAERTVPERSIKPSIRLPPW
jgi:hypothetical protein